MFRELTRKHKKIPESECIELLTKETRGVLAVSGDYGYPYAMPMNHYYSPKDGCIYFHSGKKGHRTDALRRSDKVSFCVYEQGYREEGEWALHVRSVIVFGKIELIEDREEIIRITTPLCHKFTDDEAYIRKEIEENAAATLLLKLIPEHICGKIVIES
ncbi:MAG: pyridoxamine 5'-phosphate oxidase family protein [Ruminococcaceae bacterium]|nr:pyridoxamine 5'-phosphate oxidase family protein [Oscillospiraceae bacterium]